jgi:hypothetical protein
VLATVGLGTGFLAMTLVADAAPPESAEPPVTIPKQMPGKPAAEDPVAPVVPVPPPVTPAASPSVEPIPATPTPTPTPPAAPASEPFAAPVHVYVINGVDAFGFAKLREMTDRLRGNGYDAHYAQWYQSGRMERDIRQLQSQQPGTPVAIVGYSFGAYRAKAMANRLTRDGVPVTMVGYIGGDYLRNSPSDMPNGARVVNVTGNGFLPTGRNLFFNGTDLSGAENLRLGARHFDLPKQTETYDAILGGLASTGTPVTTATPVTPQPATTVASSPITLPPDSVAPRTQSSPRPLFRLVGRSER